MTIYERIEIAMKAKEITAYRLSKDTGISQSTIARWREGSAIPKANTLKTLGDYLGVSTDYLLFGNKDEEKVDSIPNKIPVLGVVPCGVPIEAIEDIIEWVDVVPSMTKEHFGLIAKGDSMSPYINNKDVLIIKKTPVTKTGKIAIVKVNGNEATCKKVLIGDDTITLIPLNTKYEPQVFTKEMVDTLPITIVGEVVEIRRRL